MSEQTNNAATEGTQATPEATNVETQQPASQAEPQADTTVTEAAVSKSMAIEEPTESETSESELPTIDSIVDEALSGELSEETKKLIEENGLGKHIDMLVAGHRAIQEKNDQEIFSVVGGEKSYQELQEWGKNNMTAEEQKAMNAALFSGDMHLAKLAVHGLKAKYVSINGKEPSVVIEGGGSSNEATRPFANPMEYIKETQTTKYKQDPEYRMLVEQKRQTSGF